MSRNLNRIYHEAADTLRRAGIANASSEAEWLTEHFFQCGRAAIISGESTAMPLEPFHKALRRRAAGDPLQYILGSQFFWGMEFLVGEGVLIPRPETELLVRLGAESLNGKEEPVVFDLCAGSGCVGIALWKERPDARVFAVEREEPALCWLQKNNLRLAGGHIHIQQANILNNGLDALPPADLILCNPPYIATGEIAQLQVEVRQEPPAALDGGPDGMRFYGRLARLAVQKLKNGGRLIVECGRGQAAAVKTVFEQTGLRGAESHSDMHGIDRAVAAYRP